MLQRAKGAHACTQPCGKEKKSYCALAPLITRGTCRVDWVGRWWDYLSLVILFSGCCASVHPLVLDVFCITGKPWPQSPLPLTQEMPLLRISSSPCLPCSSAAVLHLCRGRSMCKALVRMTMTMDDVACAHHEEGHIFIILHAGFTLVIGGS